MSAPSTAVAAPGPAGEKRGKSKAGPVLVLTCFGLGSAYFLYNLLVRGSERAVMIETIRRITRVDFLFFIAAFTARPLDDLLHNRVTGWMVANRRYLGLSFGSLHLLHYPILGTMLAVMGPAVFWADFGGFALPSIPFLLLVTLMAATSFDGAQRFLGMRRWSALHTVGGYATFVWFTRIYLRKLERPNPPTYQYVYLAILGVALALRLLAAGRRWLRNRQGPISS